MFPSRPLGFLIALQLGLGLGLLWVGRMSAHQQQAAQRLEAQLEKSAAQHEKLQKQLEQLAALQTSNRQETEALRQHLTADMAQDVIFLKIMALKPGLSGKLARRIAQHISAYSKLYGHDPDLVLAIMKVESDFDPKVVSSAGATGLMQVMPQWKKVLGIQEPLTNPETSIKYGLQILGFYKQMYKSLDMALTAYNRGPGPVDAALMRGKDPKNRYAPRVRAVYQRLKTMTMQG